MGWRTADQYAAARVVRSMIDLGDRAHSLNKYRGALRKVQDEAGKLKFGDVVKIVQGRIDELASGLSDENLCEHAKRTIRSLGGMEELGDVVMTEATRPYLDSIEGLYRAAKAVQSAFGSGG